MTTPSYLIDSFRLMCDTLGGTVEKRGIEDVCIVKPHEKGNLEIILVDGKLTEVNGWNDTASINIKYIGGQPVIKIISNKEKQYALIQMSQGNTCSFERQSRIVRGSCVVDGKMVSFTIDP